MYWYLTLSVPNLYVPLFSVVRQEKTKIIFADICYVVKHTKFKSFR